MSAVESAIRGHQLSWSHAPTLIALLDRAKLRGKGYTFFDIGVGLSTWIGRDYLVTNDAHMISWDTSVPWASAHGVPARVPIVGDLVTEAARASSVVALVDHNASLWRRVQMANAITKSVTADADVIVHDCTQDEWKRCTMGAPIEFGQPGELVVLSVSGEGVGVTDAQRARAATLTASYAAWAVREKLI